MNDFLDLATRACQFLAPDRDLPQANWQITGEKHGDKRRSLIAIETALMKRIGEIHTSTCGFFIRVATKPRPAINPQTTIFRILDLRTGRGAI